MKRAALAVSAVVAAFVAAGCHPPQQEQPSGPAPTGAYPTSPADNPPPGQQQQPVPESAQVAPPAPPQPNLLPARIVPLPNEPLIRVGLVVDRDSVLFSATGQFRVLDAGGGTIAVTDARNVWSVRPGDGTGRLYLYRPGRQEPIALAAPVVVRPEQDGDYLLVGGKRYRGEAIILRGTAGVSLVNRVYMEQYLLSVVALELGFRAPSDREAVKAQAVAARSFALRYKGRREALGFDVYPTDADQVYGGVDAELPEVNAAVGATPGEILVYQGRPIEALFHSTCGWSTEANEQVFQNREPVPYLRATSDRYGEGDHDFYCAISPRFRWREEWDASGLNAILARTLPVVLGASRDYGRVMDIRAGRTTPTGRVAELVVTTTTGEYTVSRVREALRPAPDRWLNSALFQLHVEKNGVGGVTKVVAAGAGYGHGVGMCQYGAVGRSRAGWGYTQILATYYDGTRLERNY